VDAGYAARYRELYERHWWWRAREGYILDTLRRHCPPDGRQSILDVGCGDGLFFPRLAKFGQVEGVEPDASLVSDDGLLRGHIHVAPFDARFQPGRSYSLILMLDVLEHLPDADEALRHAATLLEPGGRLLVTVPAFMLLWTSHDVLNYHVTRYTRRRLTAAMRRAGFEVRAARYLFQWTALAKLVLHLIETVAGGRPTPPRIPPAWLNRTLHRVSRLEYRVLRRCPVPFGSSLMVIAEKPSTP
jgi:2-polyprenyl-3-methyl-5-hydroxy-6-metoxy-1,4-benzoquinol methylase